jgi:prophage antirepressor-like protein
VYDVKNNITSSRRMDIVKAFNANDLHTEIVIKGTIDDPLFRASDVGVVLDIASIRSVLRDFDESEKVVHTMHTLGGTQEVTFLTEKGLYKVLKPSQLKSNTNKE